MTDNTRQPANSAQEPTVDADTYSQGEPAERTRDSATLTESNTYSQATTEGSETIQHTRGQEDNTTHAEGNADNPKADEKGTVPNAEKHHMPGGNTLPGKSSRGEPDKTPRAREGKAALTQRWEREGRWGEVSAFIDEVRAAYRESGAEPKTKRAANEHAWQEAARAFPPLEPPEPEPQAEKAHAAPNTPNSGESARVQGLGDIPQDWLPLPENASLQAELGWVQANRLRVVEEQASGATLVHLARAGTPAPSMAALGWLETSIRSYAKYVDVVARALSSHEDEQGMVRRERVKIERIRELLREMREETPGQEQEIADGARES